MAITRVRAKLGGTWYNLSYNSATDRYETALTAPPTTSFNLPGSKYMVGIELLDHEGYTKTESKALKVMEKTPPTINITGPVPVFDGKRPAISFDVGDEANGSGINLNSLVFTLDGRVYGYNSIGMVYEKAGDRYYFTYTPPETLPDGRRQINVDVSDNDGNRAVGKKYTFEIFGTWQRGIFDRTQADVDFLLALLGRPLTATEWEEYGAENYKGALNAYDLNRIEYDTVFVYKKMKYYGYGALEIQTKTNWNRQDFMTVSELCRVLGNVGYLVDSFIGVGALLPISLDMPKYTDINEIERALQLLKEGIEHLETQWVYSGELALGGGVLL